MTILRCFTTTVVSVHVMLATGLAMASEKDEKGFEPIFNGKNLDGWVVEGWAPGGPDAYPKRQEKDQIWHAKEGMLVCKGGTYGFLRYDKKLSDFSLRLEYRLSPDCNSGVGFRAGPFRQGDKTVAPSRGGYEMQILADHGKKPGKGSSGSLYRYLAPSENATRPPGEWNQLEIECRGPRIRITLNGKLIQDVDQTKHDNLREKPLSGYISLQDHRCFIEYRNIRLKEL
jgi:hypothetical protein